MTRLIVRGRPRCHYYIDGKHRYSEERGYCLCGMHRTGRVNMRRRYIRPGDVSGVCQGCGNDGSGIITCKECEGRDFMRTIR